MENQGRDVPLTELLFSFTGRADRTLFWISWVAVIAISLVARQLLFSNGFSGMLAVMAVLLAAVVSSISIQVRRWHDLNMSGWFVFLVLIPVLGPFISMGFLGFVPGTDGPNDYDEVPRPGPAPAPAFALPGSAEAAEQDKAIEAFSREIGANPGSVKAYSGRRLAYLKKGNFEQALADAAKVIELDPRSASAYANRGLTFAAMGEHDKAILDYTRAIELSPRYAAAYSVRAAAYRAKGDAANAEADENKARFLSSNPG